MQQTNAAFRKRNQIQKANRTMFSWVAGISALFGVALVGIIFLSQMLMFNEKVLLVKNETVATLKVNNANVPELESQVRVLDTNQLLAKLKAKADDQTIQVILDALPSEANSPALGSSLKEKLLYGIPGLSLNSMSVDPVEGIEHLSGNNNIISASESGESNSMISFRFSVTGSDNALKIALQNLERSIRTIKVTSMRIENQGSNQIMTVQGEAYYEPEKSVELIDKVVKQ